MYVPLFRLRENLATDKIGGADTRLRLLADIYDVTERAFAIKFASHSDKDVEEWYRANEGVLREFSQMGRVVQPLGSKSSVTLASTVSQSSVSLSADRSFLLSHSVGITPCLPTSVHLQRAGGLKSLFRRKRDG